MKHNLNKNKSIVTATTAATLFTLAFFVVVAAVGSGSSIGGVVNTALATVATESTTEAVDPFDTPRSERPKAPVVVSGDNIYLAWWTNNTENGNEEVMFRASSDGGATFTDKINLSNTTDADSWRVEIAGEGDTVVVSWWETPITNQTNQTETTTPTAAEATTNQTEGAAAGEAPQDIPIMRVSNDGGQTFGPMIMLATNGTISSTTEEEGAAEEEGGG